MYSKVNNLVLDNFRMGEYTCNASYGLVIRKICSDELVNIANIRWNADTKKCYIETVEDHLQDYIVSYDDYKDFIRLVDEAFFVISAANNATLEGKI